MQYLMHVWCFDNLTWSGGPMYENENFFPCRSHAQNQLPCFSVPCLTPSIPFFPPPPLHTCQHLLSSTTSTCLNLLLLGSPSMLSALFHAAQCLLLKGGCQSPESCKFCWTLYTVCCCSEGAGARTPISVPSALAQAAADAPDLRE